MEILSRNKKKLILAAGGILLILGLGLLLATGVFRGNGKSYEFSLSERDVAIDVGNTLKLSVIPEKGSEKQKADISWVSSESSVAAVEEDGTVKALAGGETRVTAIAKVGGDEYSASCVVTVKVPGNQYSNYKIRWFTQKKDRSSYDVEEEVFERLPGSEVELEEKEALKRVPEQYVLNTEKSIWKGTVKDQPGLCILEVYFDVAQIDYYVDYYYESDSKLGSYVVKETKKFQDYAFSEVQAPEDTREGFVLNGKKGSGLTEVEAGSRLSVYYDRIRSKVTVTYESGKEPAVYTNVYGVGLIDAPEGALTDSLEFYNTTSGCYLNGNRAEPIQEALKNVWWDSMVEVRLESIFGWVYNAKTGALENLGEQNCQSYAYLKGSGSSIYLSATYDITGSQSNMFGVTLRSQGTSRQIWFGDLGIYVRKDHGWESGALGGDQWMYNNAGCWDGEVFVWAQNGVGAFETEISSVTANMIRNTEASSHKIIWAVEDGVLYCNVDGVPALRLPLNRLAENWTADQTYEIGFSTFDGLKSCDELEIRDVTVCFDKEAEAKLCRNQEEKELQPDRVAYDVITGVYLPASDYGFTSLLHKEMVGDSGISADIQYMDMSNSMSAYGVTVRMGDSAEQYVFQGNTDARHHRDGNWDNVTWLRMLDRITPYNDKGTAHVDAFVKDGYFYILYNGIETQCINMLSLFPEYDPKTSKVSVGLCSCDANMGLAEFRNVKALSKEEVAAVPADQWGYYSENQSVDAFDFADASLETASKENQTAPLLGSSKIWQVEGTMVRTSGEETAMGVLIQSGDKVLRLLGNQKGILAGDGAEWLNEWTPETWKKYVLMDQADTFFGENHTKDQISFRAVIYEDVLYAWFDGVLCWRVPLTDAEFGFSERKGVSFPAGSDYELSLYVKGDLGGFGKMTDLKVKMGYQVTGQTSFVTDKAGRNYSFAEAISMIEANMEQYLAADTSGLRFDAVEENYVTFTGGGEGYLYGDKGTGDRGVSADMIWQSEDGSVDAAAGATVKVGSKSHQFMVFANRYGGYNAWMGHWTGNMLWQDNTDISEMVPGYQNAFDENGKSHMEAFVKDGYFYVKYNGVQALCVSMISLFPEYDPVKSEVSVGICGTHLQAGQAQFTNTSFLSAEEVSKIAAEQWGFYGEYPEDYVYKDFINFRKVSLKDGSFEKTQGYWAWSTPMPLYGKNKIWQVEGTMVRDANDTYPLRMGFGVKANGKELRILGKNKGFTVAYNDDWIEQDWWSSDIEGNEVCVPNFYAEKFFSESGRTLNEIQFKAVIYEDVLYVWFDGHLCWRINLSDNSFRDGWNTSFTPGSDYELTLWMGEGYGLGEMKDLKVKMGYQVTDQTAFETDSSGKTYTIAETVEQIKKNMDSYLALEHRNLMLEALEGAYVAKGKADQAAYLYGDKGTGNLGVSTDIAWLPGNDLKGAVGVTVKSGDLSYQFRVWSYKGSFVGGNVDYNNWFSRTRNHEVWGDSLSGLGVVPANTAPFDEDGVAHMEALVKDGYLYILYNGKQAFCFNMVSLFPEYDQGKSEVSVGIDSALPGDGIGQARFTNTTFLSAEDVNARETEQWGFYTEYTVDGNPYYGAQESDAWIEADGYRSHSLTEASLTKEKGAGFWCVTAPLYGKSKAWEVEGDMVRGSLDDDNAPLQMGFGVYANGKELDIMGKNAGFVPSLNRGQFAEADIWSAPGMLEWNPYVKNTEPSKFFNIKAEQIDGTWVETSTRTEDTIHFRAVLYEDVLYVWFDGKLCWQIDLTENTLITGENNSVFAKGSEYQMILWIGSGNGLGSMENLTVKMGSQVEAPVVD